MNKSVNIFAVTAKQHHSQNKNIYWINRRSVQKKFKYKILCVFNKMKWSTRMHEIAHSNCPHIDYLVDAFKRRGRKIRCHIIRFIHTLNYFIRYEKSRSCIPFLVFGDINYMQFLHSCMKFIIKIFFFQLIYISYSVITISFDLILFVIVSVYQDTQKELWICDVFMKNIEKNNHSIKWSNIFPNYPWNWSHIFDIESSSICWCQIIIITLVTPFVLFVSQKQMFTTFSEPKSKWTNIIKYWKRMLMCYFLLLLLLFCWFLALVFMSILMEIQDWVLLPL